MSLLLDNLIVGEPVARDDGRFYVPLHIERERPGLSNIILRVASDAFETVEEAQAFGQSLAVAWNSTIKILVDQIRG
jgi:hypothetical protein